MSLDNLLPKYAPRNLFEKCSYSAATVEEFAVAVWPLVFVGMNIVSWSTKGESSLYSCSIIHFYLSFFFVFGWYFIYFFSPSNGAPAALQ